MQAGRKGEISNNTPNKYLILIVEDDDTSFYFIDILLSKNNFKTIRAKNGKTAVETFINTPGIDLVLMDMIIPGIDGYEASRRIRLLNKSIPIIAQTASIFEGGKAKALQAGCSSYITKPLKKDILLKAIYDSLK